MMKRRTLLAAASGAGLAIATNATARAATPGYYTTYQLICETTRTEASAAFNWNQGFAAGNQFLYAIKILGDESRAIIIRVDRQSGLSQLMHNDTDNHSYIEGLAHANDMALGTFGGQYYMFILTFSDKVTPSLVVLSHSDNSYQKVAEYGLTLSGAPFRPSGIALRRTTTGTFDFYFKASVPREGVDARIFTGSIPTSLAGGTVAVTPAFDINSDNALVNGVPDPSINGMGPNNGFTYDPASNLIYGVYCGGETRGDPNRSVVLAFAAPNVPDESIPTVRPLPDISFNIVDETYQGLFEIEGVGVVDGKLYFNANRWPEGPRWVDRGAVMVFDRYQA